MTSQLADRGPDDEGVWIDQERGVGLGHRRLSILDLSAAGHQPMVSASGRFVLAYNGEVYNFGALRRELDAVSARPWLGESDTEVVLEAIEQWGLVPALERFVGMFAIALWDRREQTLQLARDRLGIKPLVYGSAGGSLAFGSDLRALRAHPDFDHSTSAESVVEFLRYGCVPAPLTIYRDAKKVMPGTALTFRSPSLGAPHETVWWTPPAHSDGGMSDAEAEQRVDELVREAVRSRLVADVPVGAFLSGGIDSSLVVAAMQAGMGGRRARTYSIGMDTKDYDESAAAAAVAKHLGTDHTSIRVSAAQALELVPKMSRIYDEPFADSSQIPTLLVSQLARREVKVVLSGDGGDELFGGYNRHVWAPTLFRASRLVPAGARGRLARLLGRVSPDAWQGAHRAAGPLAPGVRLAGRQVHKLAGVLECPDRRSMYLGLRSVWKRPLDVVSSQPAMLHTPAWWNLEAGRSFSEWMMASDIRSYLPDDVLTKVDRASMSVGLEARVPLLDHRLVELASRVSLSQKIRGRAGKWVLRRVLARYVPSKLFERPKMGFAIPIGTYLRGPLRSWAEDLLSPLALSGAGLLRPEPVLSAWADHLNGRVDASDALWSALMLQAWMREGR